MICLLVLIEIGEEDNVSCNNKIIKGKYHVRIMLKDVFGFAEHQEKATYG